MSDGSMKGFGQRGTGQQGKYHLMTHDIGLLVREGLITVTLKEIHGVCKEFRPKRFFFCKCTMFVHYWGDNTGRGKYIHANNFNENLVGLFLENNSTEKPISKSSKLCPNSSNPCPVTGGIIATLAKIFCVLLQLCAGNLQETAREAKYWQEMAFGKVKT